MCLTLSISQPKKLSNYHHDIKFFEWTELLYLQFTELLTPEKMFNIVILIFFLFFSVYVLVTLLECLRLLDQLRDPGRLPG